jgi:hypothetical protein
MSQIAHYTTNTHDIELEIQRKGVVLGIDWSNDAQVRALAREAINYSPDSIKFTAGAPVDYQQLAKVDLFGLAAIMLRTMEESAAVGLESHGGEAWKVFARALWAEKAMAGH